MRDKKKKSIKVRDLKPRKDAKGGFAARLPTGPTNPRPTAPGGSYGMTGPTGQK